MALIMASVNTDRAQEQEQDREQEQEKPRRTRGRKGWTSVPEMRIQPNQRSPFGVWLHGKMVEKGWDVLDLAGRCRVSNSTIYKMLEFEDPNPDPPTCLRIARALEVPVIELYAVLGYLDRDSATRLQDDVQAPIRVRE